MLRRSRKKLAVLGLILGWAAPVAAVCLGCPPVAWKAELHLDDGARLIGFLEAPSFAVANRVDLSGPGLPTPWLDWAPQNLQLWTRALAVRDIWDGYCASASRGTRNAAPERCRFSLPHHHLFLVGEPRTVQVEDVASIEDASCLEGCIETVRALRLSDTEAERLVRPPVLALKMELSNDGTVAYCFSYAQDFDLDQLVPLCRSDPQGDTAPPLPPEVVRVLIDAGT